MRARRGLDLKPLKITWHPAVKRKRLAERLMDRLGDLDFVVMRPMALGA